MRFGFRPSPSVHADPPHLGNMGAHPGGVMLRPTGPGSLEVGVRVAHAKQACDSLWKFQSAPCPQGVCPSGYFSLPGPGGTFQ